VKRWADLLLAISLKRWAGILTAALLISFSAGGLVAVVQRVIDFEPRPTTPTASASTPADPLAWYKSLPTASPGCPKSVAPGLEPFYPNCF
jgi:hypothetical protein